LQEALTAGAVTTFVWDVGTGSSQRSVNAAQILGFDPRQNTRALVRALNAAAIAAQR
jgi:hypothetical protein